MKILQEARIYDDIHISLTKHQSKQSSRRIKHRFMEHQNTVAADMEAIDTRLPSG
jgi:hypothetical protein